MRIDRDTHLNQQVQREDFEFHGTGSGYFKIWIVNSLLSILTLGIYSAWAKVRTKQYFCRNMQFIGAGFDYHAKPLAILKSRVLLTLFVAALIAAAVTYWPMRFVGPLLLVCILPWVYWRSRKFEAEMYSYRDIRFSFSGSCSYGYFIVLGTTCDDSLLRNSDCVRRGNG